ncbi:hypothetical protein HDU89_002873 [Geranomyces variabilis]|nr:hypothetical protein HDU89_002873 [Geranomyces variabilis]
MECFHGAVNSPNDALLLFEACRTGLLKRVQRRLSESERTAYVVSGAIFIWDEEESGIKRWTDGKHWSPSRINGSFLIYREVEARKTVIPDVSEEKIEYVIKDGGLTKKAISITTSDGRKQHLVSYYLRATSSRSELPAPSGHPLFADLNISSDIYPEFTPESGAASIASSRSSLHSYTPSIASSHTADSGRPNYVPIPKVKPSAKSSAVAAAAAAAAASSSPASTINGGESSWPYRQDSPAAAAVAAKRQYESLDHPRPSQDSGKHMSIHSLSSMDDGRSYRSYDSQSIRSYDNYSVRSMDAQSVRSYNSHDEQWAPPRDAAADRNHHLGYRVELPPSVHHHLQQHHHEPAQYDQTVSNNNHPVSSFHGSSRIVPPSLHRSPSMVSAMTCPPEFQNAQYGGSRIHTSPHRASSVRSLPIGVVEGGVNGAGASKRELVLPPPKPSSVHHFPLPVASNSMTPPGGEKSTPMFLAHMNWTPDKNYRRGGGSLEGVSRLGLSGAAAAGSASSGASLPPSPALKHDLETTQQQIHHPQQQQQQQQHSSDAMDWEPVDPR